MAWELVNYTCGHQVREQFYGKHTERDRLKAWKEGNLCPVCFKAQEDVKKAVKSQESAEAASENGYAKLAGSEKQIAWAETIRVDLLKKISDYFNGLKFDNAQVGAKEGFLLYIKSLSNETSAKFWIDNRDYSASEILKRGGFWLMEKVGYTKPANPPKKGEEGYEEAVLAAKDAAKRAGEWALKNYGA